MSRFIARFARYLAGMAGLAGLLATFPVQAQIADPWVSWQTAETPHFTVHYRATHRAQAEQMARVAERVYPRITGVLGWQPQSRTQVVLFGELDLVNAYATPLPANTMGIFLSVPQDGELLDNSAWLDLVVAHEFTHIVHLDKARAAPLVLRRIFGRNGWFFPNVFEPSWSAEGLAVYHESDPASGRGRLFGPEFEAWLRAEQSHGFISLREINADGRSLPAAKAYLYGAYFNDFIKRRYGEQAIYKMVERYSGNIVPRLHTKPYDATGKTMDVLWQEFLQDLDQQVTQRSAGLRATPEVSGDKLAGPYFSIDALAGLPDASLAVVNDGLGPVRLVRLEADGPPRTLATVNAGARLSATPEGEVLLTQPDLCNGYYAVYDLYRVERSGRVRQLTHCRRIARAVQVGEQIVALRQDGGHQFAVLLDASGREERVLWDPPEGADLTDLALSPHASRVVVVSKRGGDWSVVELDLARPDGGPRVLFRHDAPVHGLQGVYGGLEFIAARDGVYDVWRWNETDGSAWLRRTRTHTAVTLHGSPQRDGSQLLAVLAHGGYELRRLPAYEALQRVVPPQRAALEAGIHPALAPEPPPEAVLGEGRRYTPWRSLAPRSWWPILVGDRGLTTIGASTFGADAPGWHQYFVSAAAETSQKEGVFALEYQFLGRHAVALSRTLDVQATRGDDEDEEVTVYDRITQAQWLSVLPLDRLKRRIRLGVGAAMEREERVFVASDTKQRFTDNRLAAAFAQFDTSGANWWSEGPNRGLDATLLLESYRPFADDAGLRFDGDVLRADLRGYVPLGRHVLGLRLTEVRARGRTEPFELGGAFDPQLQFGPVLNSRDIALRGYRGDEAFLTGQDARVASVEWRLPIADIDRHAMVPPIGINRLSGTVFFDIGGAWNTGSRPAEYFRGVGFELIGEVKLLYALGLQLRGGVARALDGDEGTRAYLAIGRGF